jgi:hypothetical protein
MILTDEEAEKLKRKLARERARYLEDAEREARSRRAVTMSAKKQKKVQRKQHEQRKAAVAAARAAGRTPKPAKRSVFALQGGAVETNRRKF